MIKSYPKPQKTKKSKKNLRQYMCVECGTRSETSPVHSDECTGEGEVFYATKKHTELWFIKEALDRLVREIVGWRDGVTCVTPSGQCSNVPNWGHVIPQGANQYLVYNLSNSFRQCSNHNLLHSLDNQIMYDWFRHKWGNTAWRMLNEVKHANRINPMSQQDYEDLRADLWELYSYRHQFSITTKVEELVAHGFYGPIIKEAFIKDGKI